VLRAALEDEQLAGTSRDAALTSVGGEPNTGRLLGHFVAKAVRVGANEDAPHAQALAARNDSFKGTAIPVSVHGAAVKTLQTMTILPAVLLPQP
jgi:hypothetical protein